MEIEITIKYIETLLNLETENNIIVKQSEIGVVTPYIRQVCSRMNWNLLLLEFFTYGHPILVNSQRCQDNGPEMFFVISRKEIKQFWVFNYHKTVS